MFKEIKIQNFKIFKDFECKNFQLINIFSGSNNVGKTTLLEALFLLAGYSNIELIQRLFSWRKLNMIERRDLKFFFSYLNVSPTNSIKISGKYNKDQLEFCYQPLFDKNDEIYGLKSTYKYNSSDSGESSMEYAPHKVQFSMPGLNIEQQSPFVINDIKRMPKNNIISTKMLYSYDLPNSIDNFLQIIRKKDAKQELIKVLNNIFPEEKIIDLVYTNHIIEILTEEHKEALPISFLGGGMNKIFSLLNALNHPYKTILIDEIENGLHYSKMYPIILNLFTVAIEKKIQLFITTHSKDMIIAINKILEKEENIKKHFQHYSLFRSNEKNNQIKTTVRNADNFIMSNQTSRDIRT